MRPAYLRPESTLMRRARQADLAAHRMRPADLLALALGYALMLAGLVVFAIWLVDTIQGRPGEVLPQLRAFLAWVDGL